MASKPKKAEIESELDDDEAEDAAAESTPSKWKVKLPLKTALIVAAALLILSGGGAAAYFYFGGAAGRLS